MKKRILYALRPECLKDRDAIQSGLGFLPHSKGSTFIINPVQNNLQTQGEEDDDEDEDEDEDETLARMFPEITVTQEKLLPVRARRLDAGD